MNSKLPNWSNCPNWPNWPNSQRLIHKKSPLMHCKTLLKWLWFWALPDAVTKFTSCVRKGVLLRSRIDLSQLVIFLWVKGHIFHGYCGAFNLHLLEFNFVYQFYSRKTTIVESTFWDPVGLFAFMSFHNHFKIFWYCVLLKMRGIFCPYLLRYSKWHLNW